MKNKKEGVKFFGLGRQYGLIGPEVDRAVRKVMLSGNFILGEEVSAFEKEFARYCGASAASGVASGTEALYLALRACGIRPGDEVVTVANAGVPAVVAIEMAGGVPVFADVDPATCVMDARALEKKVTRRTRAVVPVHLYGRCADMDGIMHIARKKGLKVVEDACQAHGAVYKGRKAGAIGDAGCFSFYPTKNLGCYGDGGMVITSDSGTHAKVKMLRDYGQSGRYRHEYRGINSRLDELQAAVLRVKLRRLDAWNRARAAIAAVYDSLLDTRRISIPDAAPKGAHVYHLYVVNCDDRDGLRRHLSEKGIGTLVHYPEVVYRQKAYKDLARGNRCPNSERLCGTVLSLPVYPELRKEEAEMVCEAVNGFKG